MRHHHRSRVQRHALGLLLAGACASAGAGEWTGRGIFPFNSDVGCPFAAPSAQAGSCNRIALDNADTGATLDVAAHTIRFDNAHKYAHKTIVGDVLLQGTGVDANGQRVPLNFHLLLSKSGHAWSASSHVHAPVKGDFRDVKIDLYEVKVMDGGTERVLLAPAAISAALSKPALAARLASELVQVRDSREKNTLDGDITIGLGLGKASKSVMHAHFHTDPVADQDLDAIFKHGTWALKLEALTGHIPDYVIPRELFLFGLDQRTLLHPLLERGFKKHETLTVGAVNGRGYLRYGEQQQDFAEANGTARMFLQQSFIGLLLGWQQFGGGGSAR
ncbi:hypothetical protein AAKU55_001021 [Oxalobacteraceae bacterium GrIS 1.11]